MDAEHLTIEEYDEGGALTATYVQSAPQKEPDSARVDIVLPRDSKTLWQRLLDVFLPTGYPQSVTDDYIGYRIYNAIQAFASSIAGLLASRAVLEGVGVGDATATPTAALLLSMLQDSTGRLATILFAHRLGTSLEPECKAYRLAADVFNDAAMVLDCLSPAFPKALRVLVLSCSSVLRALCGVAAGSAKASLSKHFARSGNLGELSAKDSSQETVLSLLGMLAGSLLVSHISSPLMTWSTLILLLTLHLSTNHAAVRAVQLRSLNRQRANIVFAHLLTHSAVLTPAEAAAPERIFERDGVVRWADGRVLGWCEVGVSLGRVLGCIGEGGRHDRTGAVRAGGRLEALMKAFETEEYLLWHDAHRSSVLIVLKQGAMPEAQLKAWMQGVMVLRRASSGRGKGGARLVSQDGDGTLREGQETNKMGTEAELSELKITLDQATETFATYAPRLRAAGWDLDSAALETWSGTRIGRGTEVVAKRLLSDGSAGEKEKRQA